MKTRLFFFAFLATGALVLRADANAPGDQYGPFGQSDSSIRDLKTGLEWRRSTFDPQIGNTFQSAATACASSNLLGHTDWRLPTVKELLTIVDEAPHSEYQGGLTTRYIDPNAFPATPTGGFWTLPGPTRVDFSTGVAQQQSGPGPVRCVRTFK